MSYRVIIGKKFIDREVSTIMGAEVAAEAVFDHIDDQKIFIIDTETMGVVSRGEMTVVFHWESIDEVDDPMSKPKDPVTPEVVGEANGDHDDITLQRTIEDLDDESVLAHLEPYLGKNVGLVFDSDARTAYSYGSIAEHYRWDPRAKLRYANMVFDDGRALRLPGTQNMLAATVYRVDLMPPAAVAPSPPPLPSKDEEVIKRQLRRYLPRDIVIDYIDGSRSRVAYSTLTNHYRWPLENQLDYAVSIFEEGNELVLPGTSSTHPGSAFRPDRAPAVKLPPGPSAVDAETADDDSEADDADDTDSIVPLSRAWNSYWEGDPVLIIDDTGDRRVVTFGELIDQHRWGDHEADWIGMEIFDNGIPQPISPTEYVFSLAHAPAAGLLGGGRDAGRRTADESVSRWAEGLGRMFGTESPRSVGEIYGVDKKGDVEAVGQVDDEAADTDDPVGVM